MIPSRSHNQAGWSKIKVVLMLAVLFIVLAPLSQSQGAGGDILLTDDVGTTTYEGEFPQDLEEAKKQYHHAINCFFNVAVDKHIELMNKKYTQDTKNTARIERPDLGDCNSLSEPIQKNYMEKLKKLLGSIDKNIADAGKKQGEEPALETVDPERMLCNIDLSGNPMKLVNASGETDYFEFEQQSVISPTYAVALVSNCYFFVYQQYLNQRIQQSLNAASVASESEATHLSLENITQLQSRRKVEAVEEMTRSETSLDLALASLEEMIQAYPVHIRYQEIIDHSEKLRDQFARIRVPLDQLQYKLVNQSTKSCE